MTINAEMLQKKANDIRIDIIREVHAAASGHPGGSLSATDIITYLFFSEMNIDPKDPEKKDRDKFVLSKGHAAPALYAALAEKGFFPKEELLNLRKIGSILQGHPDKKKIPGVDMSTGSLGQGVSVAVGMALANKIDKNPGRVYSVLGDGELQEGLVWEAAMAASHYSLDNLTIFIDWNGLQIDGKNEDVITVAPIDEKFKSFGWDVAVIDGHSFEEIAAAVEHAKKVSGKPQAIIAKTVKGKGVSFMENQAGWHGKAPNDEQAAQAVAELGGKW
jgi:transketolase